MAPNEKPPGLGDPAVLESVCSQPKENSPSNSQIPSRNQATCPEWASRDLREIRQSVSLLQMRLDDAGRASGLLNRILLAVNLLLEMWLGRADITPDWPSVGHYDEWLASGAAQSLAGETASEKRVHVKASFTANGRRA